MERYIAFDVETPNYNNDRMSAIGLAVIEGGQIVDSFATLVDPETFFSPFNVALTGITPEAVQGAPSFPALWQELRPLLESGTLLAHNASFDLRVLSLCLAAYALPHRRFVPYGCTVQMGRRCYPSLPNHKLNTLCGALDITLDHHRADSDSLACAELFLNYRRQGLDTGRFLRRYDLDTMRTLSPTRG